MSALRREEKCRKRGVGHGEERATLLGFTYPGDLYGQDAVLGKYRPLRPNVAREAWATWYHRLTGRLVRPDWRDIIKTYLEDSRIPRGDRPYVIIRERDGRITARPLELTKSGRIVEGPPEKKKKESTVPQNELRGEELLKAIGRGYVKYLKKTGVWDFILTQSDCAWPVPLKRITESEPELHVIRWEDLIRRCRELNQAYVGFIYAYQPFAKGDDKHIIRIRPTLLKQLGIT